MANDYTIKDWLANYGGTKSFGEVSLIDCGWWDWFEYGTTRRAKFTKQAAKMLKRIVNSPLVKDDYTIFFKQSLSGEGYLYEDFRICDAEGNVMFCVGLEPSGWFIFDFCTGEKYNATCFDTQAFENAPIENVYEFFKV